MKDKTIKLMSDEELAKEWRRRVDENRQYSQELLDRGYKFTCIPHGQRIELHGSADVKITKQETKEL